MPSPATVVDSTVLRGWAGVGTDALEAAREEIDELNVYPVPDGDTGTNLHLTVEAAALTLTELPEDATAAETLAVLARGALLGARGNSGVILSQVLRGLADWAGHDAGKLGAVSWAAALTRGAEAAYAAVGEPVEGTMLTVLREAAAAATAAARDDGHLTDVVRAAAAEATAALARTPDQLEVLRRAGVVDAGGRGLSVVLDAAETAVTGRRPVGGKAPLGTHAIPVPLPSGDLTPDGPAYEVMYLLDADDAAVPTLRSALAPLGDSLVVVGGDGLWNVHVHVDDVGAALEAGIEAGRPHRVQVTHFADQVERQVARRPAAQRTGRAVVVVAAGAGLGELFLQAGATVVPGGPGRRPSTGQVLEAVTTAGAAEVIVLPNDRDSIAAAEAAARTARTETDLRVAVIATNAQVQGLAALAVHEPGRPFEQDILEMTAAARHARSGAVTLAARQAMTTAGPCEPGDVLGAVEGDFVVVGADLFAVAAEVLERLLGGGGELVTLVAGADGGDLAERCAAHLAATRPTVDVVVYDGGQPRYPLLVGVE